MTVAGIFTLMERGRRMSTAVNEQDPTHEDREQRAGRLLGEACEEADPAQAARLREQVVLDHQNLAVGLAKRFESRGVELEDLVQVAMLGLVQAARRYRPDRGPGFTAFASPTITGELKRYFRDHGWAVRPPRGLQETHHRVRETTTALQQEMQQEPSVDDIAAEGGLEPEEVRAAQAAGSRYRATSLDKPVGDGSGPSLAEALPDGSDDPYDKVVTLISLRAAMKELDSRDRRILDLRFGANLTQRQIGELVGVSQMQVSRILGSICRRLQSRVEE